MFAFLFLSVLACLGGAIFCAFSGLYYGHAGTGAAAGLVFICLAFFAGAKLDYLSSTVRVQ